MICVLNWGFVVLHDEIFSQLHELIWRAADTALRGHQSQLLEVILIAIAEFIKLTTHTLRNRIRLFFQT